MGVNQCVSNAMKADTEVLPTGGTYQAVLAFGAAGTRIADYHGLNG